MRSNLLTLGWLWPLAFALLASCGGGGSSATSTRIFAATLAGTQEVPPNASGATGSGTVTVDAATRAMTATVTTTGVVGTAAHIHNGAPGVSGPVVFPLTETPAGSGLWVTTVTLSVDEFNLLIAGNYYFNIHSLAFPDGEIRGQIILQ